LALLSNEEFKSGNKNQSLSKGPRQPDSIRKATKNARLFPAGHLRLFDF